MNRKPKSTTALNNAPILNKSTDNKKRWRDLVYLLLPDGLMVFLALIVVPVIIIPFFVNLSQSILSLLQFVDYTILGIYILEYVLKTALAQNIIKRIINPWHILDLIIIVLPLAGFLPFATAGLSRYSPLLRLSRVIAVGGRTVDRRKRMTAIEEPSKSVKQAPMQIKVCDGHLGNTPVNISVDNIPRYLKNQSNTWIDINSISENDLDALSSVLGISKLILQSELMEDSYPRVDYFEGYSMVYARIAEFQLFDGQNIRLQVTRTGLLIICFGNNIITLSRTKSDYFEHILEKARKLQTTKDSPVVTVLYSTLKYVLEKNKHVITALEGRLVEMENIPMSQRSANFLEMTFFLRKEVNQLVPALLHLKEVISVIADKRMPLAGFNDSHVKIFDILLDEAGYQHETASNARDNLLSLIDLYINTNSYEMNKVMRIIAVITSMSIIPAIIGLLGSNIIGNPWDIQLWQVFSIMGGIMLIMGWIFYRLGWLKI